MESDSIELKVRSCKDLKAFNFFQKLAVYAVISIVSDDPDKKTEQNQEQRTPIDREGDGDPEWNHETRFDLDEASFRDCDHLFIHFNLRHEVLVFGEQTIGEVRVPLKGLIDESDEVVRFVSYQVRTTDGKPNGVLNFSYKVNGKAKILGTYPPASEISGFPIVHHHHQSPEIQFPTSEIHSLSPQIHYPSLESENLSQETYSAHCSSHVTQYPSHETYYPPLYLYCTQPPPPPPPLLRPPPPPVVHGPCYHLPPHPPQVLYPGAPEPYKYVDPYDYGAHGTQSPTGGRLQGFVNGESWPNGFPDCHSSHWNGR